MSIPSCVDGGKLICLQGSSCNDTLGYCTECPTNFADDQTIFAGNRNCGMLIPYVVAVYIISSLFAWYVTRLAIKVALTKTPGSRVRKVLFLNASWNFLIPFYLLAHYLSGFQQGPAAALSFGIIVIMLNVQVGILGYSLWKFMAIICNVWTQGFIYRASIIWTAFWILVKVVTTIVIFESRLRNDLSTFNYAQMFNIVSLYVEVGCNVFASYRNSVRMVAALQTLRTDQKVTALSDVVVDFVDRVKKTKNIQPYFAGLFICVVTVMIALFSVFGAAVPYQFIIWSFPALTWPLLGLGPTLRARGKFAVHMDTANGESSIVLPRNQHLIGTNPSMDIS